jgi:hypothetical protein
MNSITLSGNTILLSSKALEAVNKALEPFTIVKVNMVNTAHPELGIAKQMDMFVERPEMVLTDPIGSTFKLSDHYHKD